MNDAATKVQKDAKPKNEKAQTSTAASKSANKTANAKPKDKAADAPKTAEPGKIFRVDANGGPLRTIDQKSAIADILETKGDVFNLETIQESIDKGDVMFSEYFHYSITAKKLARWVREMPDVPAAPKREAKPDDILYHEDRQLFGKVVEVDGKLRVEFKEDGRNKSAIYKADKWRFATDAEVESFLNPVEEIVEAKPEALPSLTDEEKAELAEREEAIKVAKEQVDSAPWTMASNLAEIFGKKLNRETINPETGKPYTNAEYAFAKFNITREYAQNLAQLGNLKNFLTDGVEHSEQMQMSINAGNLLTRGLNKLGQGMTAGELKGMDALRPIVGAVGQILFDVAPKDADGNAQITPRLVQSTLDTLADVVKSDAVTIDGKQMKISEAQEQGLLSISVQSEILEKAAEGIRTNREVIRSEAQRSYDEANKPATPKPSPAPVQFYEGDVPTLVLSCSKHGPRKVSSIGTGTFQLSCHCRFRLDAATAKLVCYEVNSKKVDLTRPS